jgi:hypothetical protein
LKFDSPKLPPIAQKKKRCGKQKTKAANPTHKEKIKSVSESRKNE